MKKVLKSISTLRYKATLPQMSILPKTMAPVPVNLEDLSTADFRQVIESIDHVCCDCDGVLWAGCGTALAGAGAAVTALQAKGKTVTFVSNNSSRTKNEYTQLFDAAGIQLGYDRLVTPAWAIGRWLHSRKLSAPLYCVSSAQTVRLLQEQGFHCVTGPDQPSGDLSIVASMATAPPNIGGVVFDSDYAINVHKLHRAVDALRDPAVVFVSGASNKHIGFGDGRKLLGSGIFTDIVAKETGRTPIVLSKPSRAFGELIMEHANIRDPSRTLFVGDTFEQDVRFAHTLGFRSLLVLSGVDSIDESLAERFAPNFVATSLGCLLDKIRQC